MSHKLTLSRMLSKTQIYLDHFARFKRKENVEAVERLLSAHKELAKFERAQLGTSARHMPQILRFEELAGLQQWHTRKLTLNRIPVL